MLREHAYYYSANREWKNNEVAAFNALTGLVDRERFFVAHDQTLIGNNAELQWDGKLASRSNRLVVALEVSKLDFDRPGAANFPSRFGDARRSQPRPVWSPHRSATDRAHPEHRARSGE